MGEIISSKITDDNKVLFTIRLDKEEALQLKGHVTNICLFSENNSEIKTNIASRGKNESTKYFLIPKELRHSLVFPSEVKCAKLDTKTKTIFIYVIDKLRL